MDCTLSRVPFLARLKFLRAFDIHVARSNLVAIFEISDRYKLVNKIYLNLIKVRDAAYLSLLNLDKILILSKFILFRLRIGILARHISSSFYLFLNTKNN
jgi:hypothetical protein